MASGAPVVSIETCVACHKYQRAACCSTHQETCMTQEQVLHKTKEFLKDKFGTEGSGHDYWHMHRVWSLAKHIAKTEEGVDLFVLELAALLHDINDWKFNDGDYAAGPRAAGAWLESLGVDPIVVKRVQDTMQNIPFRGDT